MTLLPYGQGNVTVDLEDIDYQTIQPRIPRISGKPEDIIAKSFGNPVGKGPAEKFDGKTIGIAINDPTRPVPYPVMLPVLVDFLIKNGAEKKDMCFFIATGTHPPVQLDRVQRYLPEVLRQNFHIESHDCDDASNLEFLGNTNKNTPIYVNKRFLRNDLKIVTGNIEPHHFMGYSGGVKSASIGLAGRETVQRNHAMLTNLDAKMGLYDTNPMRQDIEEIGEVIGIDYALNVVMNAHKQIVACFWGPPKSVMRAGIGFNQQEIQLNLSAFRNRYDLVIASAGGYPKDINLYQSQKAITHACLFARQNAPIVLIAACGEGHGSEGFYNFFEDVSSFQDVINKFESRPFEIGPHKAYQLALQGVHHDIFLRSELREDQVRRFFLKPVHALSETIQSLVRNGGIKRIAVLPYATHTIPLMGED